MQFTQIQTFYIFEGPQSFLGNHRIYRISLVTIYVSDNHWMSFSWHNISVPHCNILLKGFLYVPKHRNSSVYYGDTQTIHGTDRQWDGTFLSVFSL